ncbi:hypothetical protein [Glaciimonas soli]|uniref:hypothetical protein n=1 Tax=Glaciimonas soli TaxID=2590999 RepID=UPI001D1700C9|nr:hypothetical protein [Glaciimonas soli]
MTDINQAKRRMRGNCIDGIDDGDRCEDGDNGNGDDSAIGDRVMYELCYYLHLIFKSKAHSRCVNTKRPFDLEMRSGDFLKLIPYYMGLQQGLMDSRTLLPIYT